MSGTKFTLPNLRTMLILLVAVSVIAVMPLAAQDQSRNLVAGTTLSGSLSPDTTAASYVFDAGANSTAQVTLDNVSGGALALHLSDINGKTIAAAVDSGVGSVSLSDIALSSGGRYFVFVYFAPGSGAQDATYDLSFDLTAGDSAVEAEAVAEEVPDLILLGAGVDVTLDLEWRGRFESGSAWSDRTNRCIGIRVRPMTAVSSALTPMACAR